MTTGLRLLRASFLRLCIAAAVVAGTRNGDAQSNSLPTSAAAVGSHAEFLPNTLIPKLAMGVRRSVKDSREVAELRDRPGGTALARVPLFTPMYVHGEQRLGTQEWVLLASGYATATAGPRGWIPRSEVEVFFTRYGYILQDTGETTEFFPTPKAAYAIVPEIGPKTEMSPSRLASVLGRPGVNDWRPSRRTDLPPFMELDFERQSGYPSTTPSTATPYDGRLVRLGAICGGPVDAAVLGKLRKEAEQNADVEMLFVVDETWSMKEFFTGVADFIRDVGQAAGGGFRIAVSYYTDGPQGERTTCSSLQKATPQVVTALADSVRQHKQQMPKGDYVNPPERMLDGVREAINKAGFTEGVTSIVVVIGDTGHEPKDPDREKLLDEVARLIVARRLMVFFVHVGLKGTEMSVDQALFKQDADAVRQRVGGLNKSLADRVRYTTANANSLTAELEASRREVDRLAEQARLMAGRITSRNTHTTPGPALVAAMAKDGFTLAKFNEVHQQIYVPSYAWVLSPKAVAGKGGTAAQLSRYVHLALEEQQSLAALLESAARNVDAGLAVDHDTAVLVFVQSLSAATNATAVVEAAHAKWKKLGPGRTAGGFLDQFLGLALRSEPLFSLVPLGSTPESAEAKKALQLLSGNVRAACRDKDRFWFEAAFLTP